MLLGLPMVVLKDQYGWGFRKRLPRFADQVIAEYMKFDKVKSLKELQDFIYESSGMKFFGRVARTPRTPPRTVKFVVFMRFFGCLFLVFLVFLVN